VVVTSTSFPTTFPNLGGEWPFGRQARMGIHSGICGPLHKQTLCF